MLLFIVDIKKKSYYNIVSMLKEWLIITITYYNYYNYFKEF